MIMKLQKFLLPGSRKNGSQLSATPSNTRSSDSKSSMSSVRKSPVSTLSRSLSPEISTSDSSAASSAQSSLDDTKRLAPQKHIQELRHAFRYFDANGDGKISVTELGCVLRSLGDSPTDEDLELMVREVDKDGDGFVDFDEFVHLNTVMLNESSVAGVEELRAAFHVFDVDRNGFISAEELFQVLQNLGETGVTMDDCNRMIGGVDKDGDGFVDFEEFQKMMMNSTIF